MIGKSVKGNSVEKIKWPTFGLFFGGGAAAGLGRRRRRGDAFLDAAAALAGLPDVAGVGRFGVGVADDGAGRRRRRRRLVAALAVVRRRCVLFRKKKRNESNCKKVSIMRWNVYFGAVFEALSPALLLP